MSYIRVWVSHEWELAKNERLKNKDTGYTRMRAAQELSYLRIWVAEEFESLGY